MNRSRIAKRLDSAVQNGTGMRFPGIGGALGGLGRYYVLPGAKLDYEQMAGDLWQTPVVSIALNWISDNIAEPPLVVEKFDKDGDKEVIRDHPILDLLKRPTDGAYDWPTLLSATALSLKTDGSSYWRLIRGRGNRIVQAWYVPHFDMRPLWPADGSEYISDFGQRIDGKWYRIKKGDCCFIRSGMDPRNSRFGLAALKAMLREIVGDVKASNFIAALMRNHAVPSIQVSPKTPDVEFEKEERDAIKAQWIAEYGDENAGTVSVVSVPMDVSRVGYSPKELALGDMTHGLETKIVASLGLNTLVLNLPAAASQNKFANLAEGNRHAYSNCLIPLGRRACSGIEQSPIGQEYLAPGETLALDWSQVQALREDQGALTDQVVKAFGTAQAPGLITRNQGLAKLGYPTLPANVGDIFADGMTLTGQRPQEAAAPTPPAGKPPRGEA